MVHSASIHTPGARDRRDRAAQEAPLPPCRKILRPGRLWAWTGTEGRRPIAPRSPMVRPTALDFK